jgi:VanZ family protein
MKQWSEKYGIGISLVLVVAVMVIIFCFSAQTGESSGAASGFLSRWVVEHVVPGYEKLTAEKQVMLRDTVELVIRKAGHFSEYALLGAALLLHIRQIQKRVIVRHPWLWTWGVGTLYAVSDEFHQGFVAGRAPSATDVLIDSCGVVAGAAALLLCMWLWYRLFPGRKTVSLGDK